MNIPDGFTEWVWTEDKPYPETLETKVKVMFRDGYVTSTMPDQVGWWWSEIKDADNWFPTGSHSDIIAYKVAKFFCVFIKVKSFHVHLKLYSS